MKPFTGELMTCVCCGRIERSKPNMLSHWRAIEIDEHTMIYACPNEFPPDGSPKADFQRAYAKVLNAAIAKTR